MFDPAQESVIVVKDDPLLGGQAPDLLELRDRRERGAMPHLGIFTPVQQLQELHHELDVANAAVTGLDLDSKRFRPKACAARSGA